MLTARAEDSERIVRLDVSARDSVGHVLNRPVLVGRDTSKSGRWSACIDRGLGHAIWVCGLQRSMDVRPRELWRSESCQRRL